MPSSTYKGYELQTTGSNVGTWGSTLNNNALAYIDQNMGGITTVTLSSSDVTLSESQSRSAIIRLTGVLLANVTVTVSNLTAVPNQYGGGFFFVENLTSGNFTVSIRNTNVATAAAVPQGTRATLISDATNGVRVASNDGFASGVSTLFFNTNAPSGWTKSTTHNNKALRIVSSSGGGTGGTGNFTDIFGARTIIASNLPDHNITITDPGHTHSYVDRGALDQNGFYKGRDGNVWELTGTFTTGRGYTSITAAFGSTARGGAQTNMDFAVAYVDAIICVKD